MVVFAFLFQKNNDAKPLKGVVYYDENDNQVILLRGRSHAIPLSQSKVAPGERGTIYDQRHTTGSDIAQAPNATAVVICNQHTRLRDLEQSVFRMRKITKKGRQKARFAVEKDAVSTIINTLEMVEGITIDRTNFTLKFEHLVRYAAYKQGLVQGDNNFRALNQKLQTVLIAEFFSIFLDFSVPNETVRRLTEMSKPLFETENSDVSWELFGIAEDEVTKEWLLDPKNLNVLLGDKLIKIISKMANDPFLATRIDMNQIKEKMHRIVRKYEPLLTITLMLKRNNYGKETNLKNENEAKNENMVKKETNTEIDTETNKNQYFAFYSFNPSHFALQIQRWLKSPKLQKNKISKVIGRILGIQQPRTQERFNFQNIFSVSALLEESPDALKAYKDFFDPSLVVTRNFAPIPKALDATTSNPAPYEAFKVYQKGVSGIAYVEDRPGQGIFVLLGHDDLKEVRVYLSTPKEATNGKILLYTLDKRVDRSGGMNVNNIKQNPQFQMAVVQAKFLDGRVDYTDDEIPYLEEWIQAKGVEFAENLFSNYILKWKKESESKFKYSRLAKLFKELKNNRVSSQ